MLCLFIKLVTLGCVQIDGFSGLGGVQIIGDVVVVTWCVGGGSIGDLVYWW